jgi:phage major head subunit gpT-like protein
VKKLRLLLSQLASDYGELRRHAPSLFRGVGHLETLGIPEAKRAELLTALKAGEPVELEVELLAYEQKTGEPNRKFLRFRDGSMVKLARTGKGTPFLRDHEQWNSLAVAGEIIASTPEKLGDGHYVIKQTVKLSADWAVKIALEGNLKAVSIGWNPTGPILCSVHNAPVWSKPECYCWPGQRFAEQDGEGGAKRLVRKADGPITVEFIYTEAELVETSMVPIGGVRTAHAEEIRASLFTSLSHGNPAQASALEAEFQHLSQETETMPPELLKLLGLPETATIAEVTAAINKLQGAKAADDATSAIQQSDVERLTKLVGDLTADKAKRDQDTFVSDALASGRIAKGEEENWRALHAADPKKAVELMGKRPASSATPVSAPMQSHKMPDANDAPVAEVRELRIEGGDVPGGLYAVGQRSKTERKELAQALSTAVQALETCANPAARWWAERMGFDGRLRSMPGPQLAGSAIVNNADLDAARTAFRAVFMQELEGAAVSPLEMLYTTVPTNTPLAKLHWMGDLPGFEEWTTDRKMAGLDAFKLNLESKKWASGLRLKNDDVKFDSLGLLPQQIAGLAIAARRHRLDRMVQMLIQGFAGGTVTDGLGYDGAFFFSDSHATGDNKGTAALDAAGLTAAELLLESMTQYNLVDPLDVHGSHLVVGPKLRATAEKLLTQERLANGEDNYHRGKYKLIVDNRLRGTADDYWFLGDLTKNIKPFIFQLVEEISTSAILGNSGGGGDSVPRFVNDELWYGAEANYNMAYFEHRLLVGSVL